MHLLRAVVWLLPHSRVKSQVLRLLGVDLDRTAIVGPNLVWRCLDVTIGANAVLGAGNVLSGLRRVHIGQESSLGHWNWISAAAGFAERDSFGCLTLGRGAAVTSRHYIDTSGGVSIGEMTTFAGHRSTILTHGIDVGISRQVAAPVTIGEYSIVGSNTKLVPGASVSDHCMVAMGSVVTGGGTSPYALWGGNPARKIKDLPSDGRYWTRESPAVGITEEQQAN